jgi:hypothetical protein
MWKCRARANKVLGGCQYLSHCLNKRCKQFGTRNWLPMDFFLNCFLHPWPRYEFLLYLHPTWPTDYLLHNQFLQSLELKNYRLFGRRVTQRCKLLGHRLVFYENSGSLQCWQQPATVAHDGLNLFHIPYPISDKVKCYPPVFQVIFILHAVWPDRHTWELGWMRWNTSF